MRNVSWSLIIFCIWPQPSATFKCDAVLILIFMDCGGARAVCEGCGQNKLPLIPMEGKVQINSYSHFNAFMLMWVPRKRMVNPHEEEEEEEEGGRRVDVKFCTWEISRHEGKLAWKMELMRYRPICRRHANTHTHAFFQRVQSLWLCLGVNVVGFSWVSKPSLSITHRR